MKVKVETKVRCERSPINFVKSLRNCAAHLERKRKHWDIVNGGGASKGGIKLNEITKTKIKEEKNTIIIVSVLV